jgi:phosphoglycerate kinase
MIKSIKDFNVKNKKVLLRCDFNVPIDDSGVILDDFRIKKTLPTIQYLLNNNAKIILLSHLGEPHGKVLTALTLNNVKEKLQELLGLPVIKTDDCIGQEVENQVSNLQSGQIVLLENLRFHNEETDNNLDFAKKLAAFGDMYINDAFSDCHRLDASMVSIPTFLPSGAGLLLQEEITQLSKILKKPKKPMVVLVGGVKVKTKSQFIEKISETADVVLVSGLIKKQIMENNMSFTHPKKILGPAEHLDAQDIDGKTLEIFTKKIMGAKTIVWNGPFGKFEDVHYKKGTLALAQAIIKSKAFSVVGGGETVEFLQKEGIIDQFSHVSTGGGAMLDYLSGEELPGIKALEK